MIHWEPRFSIVCGGPYQAFLNDELKLGANEILLNKHIMETYNDFKYK